MAEQEEETSSADPKKKSSLLDEDIGKEFLSSWKSISMDDDDGMDFSLNSVPTGKKKTYNFDKLDMDFNLDGEFDKISSFKVDMSDLDFSCPPKIPAKSIEKKEGESSGAKEGKQDDFNFSFDFNELDSFNLDSCLTKGDMTLNSKQNKKVTTADGSNRGATRKPKPSDAESIHASKDSVALKSLPSDREETLKEKTLVCDPGDRISILDDSFSKFSSSGNLEMSTGVRTSSDICKTSTTEERDRERQICKTSTIEETDRERQLPEKTKSSESRSQEVIKKSLSNLVEQNDSEQERIPDQHIEPCSQGKTVFTDSGDKQKANHDKAISVNSDDENLPSDNSSPLHIYKSESNDGEAITLDSSNQGEAANDLQPVKSDLHINDNKSTGLLKKISDDKVSQKSTFDCHKAPVSSQPLVDTLTEDKEIQGRQSKYVLADKKPLMYQLSTAQTKGISFGCQKVGDRCLTTIVEARESSCSIGTESGSESVDDSIPAIRERMTDAPIFMCGKDDVKSSSNSRIREGIVSNGMESGGKLAGIMQSLHKEVKKSKPILLENSMPTKNVNILSSQLNPSSISKKIVRHAVQKSVSPQADISGQESLQKLKLGSVEGNKLASISAGKTNPASSSLKISRIVGTKKVPATSLFEKENNSSGNSEQNAETQGITASKNDHFFDFSDKQKLLTPFLKRKNTEVSEADLVSLRSLKRLSQPPSKIRSSKECSEKVVEQVESHDPISRLENSPQMNLTELGIPDSILVEDNSNIEKAEAYTKELENICIMLKKKHEEAKEILVQAIVNNNNLLMLDHPIYEEKIRKVQKFASQLKSQGIRT